MTYAAFRQQTEKNINKKKKTTTKRKNKKATITDRLGWEHGNRANEPEKEQERDREQTTENRVKKSETSFLWCMALVDKINVWFWRLYNPVFGRLIGHYASIVYMIVQSSA